MMNYSEILQEIYYNPSNPAAFGSIKKLYNAARKVNSVITLNDVKTWLSGENT